MRNDRRVFPPPTVSVLHYTTWKACASWSGTRWPTTREFGSSQVLRLPRSTRTSPSMRAARSRSSDVFCTAPATDTALADTRSRA
jgi:hypothetical protein